MNINPTTGRVTGTGDLTFTSFLIGVLIHM